MIWYRHWLEVRMLLLLLAGTVMVFAGPWPGLVPLGDDAGVTAFGREMLTMPIARGLPDDAVLDWLSFAERIWTVLFVAGFVLGGNGVRSLAQPGYQGGEYTLTLPLSRARLIATRIMVTTLGAIGALLLVMTAHTVALLAKGQLLPATPMLLSFAFGIPAAAAWASIVTACLTWVRPFWSFILAALLGVPFVLPVRHLVTALPAHGEMPWAALAGCVLVAAAAFALTLRRAAGDLL